MQIFLAISLNNKVYAMKMQQIANMQLFQDEKLEMKNAGLSRELGIGETGNT